MTTKGQVRKLLNPLLNRHEDLHLSGRMLVVKPLRHILRAVLFFATSSSDWFQPYWMVTHVCQTKGIDSSQWSKDILSLDYRSWTWNDPIMPDEFCGIFENQILPMLRPLDSLESLVAWARKQNPDLNIPEYYPLANLSLAVALGDLEAARRMLAQLDAAVRKLAELKARKEKGWFLMEDAEALAFVAKALRGKLKAGDREGLARQLHAWEAERVAKLGLQDIWQPSPFPVELGSNGV